MILSSAFVLCSMMSFSNKKSFIDTSKLSETSQQFDATNFSEIPKANEKSWRTIPYAQVRNAVLPGAGVSSRWNNQHRGQELDANVAFLGKDVFIFDVSYSWIFYLNKKNLGKHTGFNVGFGPDLKVALSSKNSGLPPIIYFPGVNLSVGYETEKLFINLVSQPSDGLTVPHPIAFVPVVKFGWKF